MRWQIFRLLVVKFVGFANIKLCVFVIKQDGIKRGSLRQILLLVCQQLELFHFDVHFLKIGSAVQVKSQFGT